jgi:capsular polysaccharide biosynthesis protein
VPAWPAPKRELSSTPAPPPDLDAEQEVDFGRYWRLIAQRWWLPVIGLVAGLVVGYLVSLGTHSSTYKATALVYLGQPLAPDGAAPVSSAPTTLGLVSNLVASAATVREVAVKSGLKPGRLSGHITTKPVTGITAAKVGTPAPLLAITVNGSPPRKIAEAANRLAAVAVSSVSGYPNVKIAKLKEQIDFDDKSIARNNDRFAIAQRQQQTILADKSLSATEKLLLLANINTTLVTVEQRLGQLETDRLSAQQFLSLAENVERPSVRSPAVAVKSAGPNSRTGAAVGGLIGLIIGVLVALLWDPVAARRTTA